MHAGNNVNPATTPSGRGPLTPLAAALTILLLVQIAFALVLELGGRDLAPAQSQGPLLAIDRERITRIRIEDPETEPLVLERKDGAWRIPGLGDFPAAAFKIDELLGKLAAIEKRLPVATSESALTRFKVAETEFERRLTLEGADIPAATLYLGDSPGFRRLYVRAAGEQAVYEAELALFDASEKANDWTDKAHLHLPVEDILGMRLADASVERENGVWRLADAAEGEELDQQAVDEAARQLASLDFSSVAAGAASGKEADSSVAPQKVFGVTLGTGETREYRLSEIGDSEDWSLQVSDLPYTFVLPAYVAEGLAMDRASLLQASVPVEAEDAGPDDNAEPETADDPDSSPAPDGGAPGEGGTDPAPTQ
jgi:hypothetical protein